MLLFFALFIIIPSPVHTHAHTHNRPTIVYTPPRQVEMSSTEFSVPGLSPEVGTRLTEIDLLWADVAKKMELTFPSDSSQGMWYLFEKGRPPALLIPSSSELQRLIPGEHS